MLDIVGGGVLPWRHYDAGDCCAALFGEPSESEREGGRLEGLPLHDSDRHDGHHEWKQGADGTEGRSAAEAACRPVGGGRE